MHSLGEIFATSVDAALVRATAPAQPSVTAASGSVPDASKRPAPFSIRLSGSDRIRLEHEAGGQPLGGYIKQKVLGTPPPKTRRTGIPVRDQQALAQLVALLGRARLFEAVAELARLARSGALPTSPETANDLRLAVLHIRQIRLLLLMALGLKPDGVPAAAATAGEDA